MKKFITVFSLILAIMVMFSVSVFADTGEAADTEPVAVVTAPVATQPADADDVDLDADPTADAVEPATGTWDNLGTSGIIGIVVAVVILIAVVVIIVILVPKKSSQRKK